jgi:hypothetical protein
VDHLQSQAEQRCDELPGERAISNVGRDELLLILEKTTCIAEKKVRPDEKDLLMANQLIGIAQSDSFDHRKKITQDAMMNIRAIYVMLKWSNRADSPNKEPISSDETKE